MANLSANLGMDKFGLRAVDVSTGQLTIREYPNGKLHLKTVGLSTAQKLKNRLDGVAKLLLQDLVPELNDDEREFILSGIPGENFDKLFSEG